MRDFSNSLFVITGASRGLGLESARLAASRGAALFTISRQPPPGILNPNDQALSASPASSRSFHKHLNADLSQMNWVDSVTTELKALAGLQPWNRLILINNAGALEPVGALALATPEQIEANVRVNLISPMVLTSVFEREFRNLKAIKTVINVTSGVAKFPKPLWTCYSAAKAGLNAFSEAANGEEDSEVSRTRVLIFDPGIIDTQMQEEIRSLPLERFPERPRFEEFKSSGALASPKSVAEKLFLLLE